jgi:hypothetical protein
MSPPPKKSPPPTRRLPLRSSSSGAAESTVTMTVPCASKSIGVPETNAPIHATGGNALISPVVLGPVVNFDRRSRCPVGYSKRGERCIMKTSSG